MARMNKAIMSTIKRNKNERQGNRKHKSFVLRFEQLALRPCLHSVKDFYCPLRITIKVAWLQCLHKTRNIQLQFSNLYTKGSTMPIEANKFLATTKVTNSLFKTFSILNGEKKLVREKLCEKSNF